MVFIKIKNLFHFTCQFSILDSEWGEECIGFIMMCVFLIFKSVYTILSSRGWI